MIVCLRSNDICKDLHLGMIDRAADRCMSEYPSAHCTARHAEAVHLRVFERRREPGTSSRSTGVGVTICTGGTHVPCFILQATRAAVSDCYSPVRTGASAPEGSTPPPTPPASRPAERESASTQHRVSFDVGGASYDHLGKAAGVGVQLRSGAVCFQGFNTPVSVLAGLKGEAEVVRAFYQALERSADVAVAVAAIKALTSVVTKSSATTLMGLEQEVKEAALSLQRCNPTAISLKAGCELFLRYTTRTSLLDVQDFGDAKARIIEVCRRHVHACVVL